MAIYDIIVLLHKDELHCLALLSHTGRLLGFVFISFKGALGPRGPESGRRRISKPVYEITAILKEGLMGEIGCRRPYSIKLANIHIRDIHQIHIDIGT